ncbi:hypothetical protein GIB67_028195 [Kingdonia uniflora]|uniref:Rhodanese domain-containing protein n=1 Tax=Kingdonia uniflora TaxID=39325 RepID=A0A7J7KZB7_9MAGN|nr:hypothetical protein GIB67_028195 [Kingdonia uniflora]
MKMTTLSLASSALPLVLRPRCIPKFRFYRHHHHKHFSPTLLQPHPPQLLLNSSFKFRCVSMTTGSSSSDSDKFTVPKSVPVRVANELLQAGHHYLDVRSPEEFSGGYPLGAVNVPYMFKAGTGMTRNPNFLEEVSEHFGKDTEIIVGCQSGKRSLMAATDLSSAVSAFYLFI